MIDARQLHTWLGIKMRFHEWVGKRITEYGFEEPVDFCCQRSKTGGRPRTDYFLTVDMAKELSMVERTERGQATRRYFIEMEKATDSPRPIPDSLGAIRLNWLYATGLPEVAPSEAPEA